MKEAGMNGKARNARCIGRNKTVMSFHKLRAERMLGGISRGRRGSEG